MTVIRNFAQTDLEALGTLHATTRRTAYADLLPEAALARITPEALIDYWAERLPTEDEPYRILVADKAGKLVGFAMASQLDDVAELAAIHLHPDHQGSGLAGRLHDAILEVMRQWRCRSTFLWVVVGNERAQAFYRKRGWTPDGTVVRSSIGAGVDAELERWTRNV